MTATTVRPISTQGRPDPVPADPERSVSPVKWWALLGAAAIVIQVIAYIGWVTSSGFTPTVADASEIPTTVKVWVWIMQIVTPVVAISFGGYAWRKSRREGRLCFDAMIWIAWVLAYWQDPGGDFLRAQTLYNSYFLNLGSWAGHIPGFVTPNIGKLPEPLLWTGIGYAAAGVGIAMACCAAMRWAKGRWPSMGKVGLVSVALVTGAILDLLLEVLFVRTEMYQYTGAVQWLSLWGGERYQFPLYEPLLWGAGVWGVLGAVRYFVDDRGRSVVEKGADELRIPTKARTGLRLLAVVGLVNLLFGLYNLGFAGLSLYGGPTPVEDIPDYMRNEVCGPDTGYACPSPSEPIPIRETPPAE